MGETRVPGLKKKEAWQGKAPHAGVKGSSNVALAVSDEEYNDTILLHKITPDDIYKKQESIISWKDPEKALESALIFEEPAGCLSIWETICNIQEELQASHQNLHVADGELKEQHSVELFSSKKRKYSQPPPPFELSGLFAILKNIQTILQCGKREQMHAAHSSSKDDPNLAPASPMTLDDLPPDLLEEVVRHLPCRADRARLRCCSRFWRDSVQNFCEPLQLPWLLLPSSVELLYYSVTGDSFRKYRPIPIEVQSARFAGASDGDWLFLVSDNPRRHLLFHLFSGWSIQLPIAMTVESRQVDVTVTSAVLSGNPCSESFTVAAILEIAEGGNKRAGVWERNMIFWRDCGNVAFQRAGELLAEQRYLPLDTELVDLVHISGTFWYLTSEEEVARLVPVEDLNGLLRMVARGLNVQVREDFEPDEELDEDEVFKKGEGAVTRRYLVESSGQPIMVVRSIEGEWTTGIRLFRLQSDGDSTRWEELFELPSETLFIGQGCSRSYKIGQELLKVYFFHDRITRLGGRNIYWRTDSGIVTSAGVLEWPVLLWDGMPVPAASDRAPPTWLLH